MSEEVPRSGRPSEFSQEIMDVICERMANGEGLREICRDEQMPDRTTVLRWLDKHEEFRSQYARAREALMDYYAEEIIDIAWDSSKDRYEDENGKLRNDHEVVARSRLKVDTLKFLMAKLHPRRYGDSLTAEGEERTQQLKVKWEEPKKITRIILEPLRDADDASLTDELKLRKRVHELQDEIEVLKGNRPPKAEPPKLLEYNPGPLPASLDPLILKAVVDLIRDHVPDADTRPGDDVLREVLTVCGEALRSFYAGQNAA